MRIQSLRERDYALASRVHRDLLRPDVTSGDLKRLLAELLPVFVAQDLSITLHHSGTYAPDSEFPWFHRFDPAGLARLVQESPQGHRPLRIIHAAGGDVIRHSDLSPDRRAQLMESDFVRYFERASGLGLTLVGHIRDRPGGSLGTVNFYRETDLEEFDDERAFLLKVLHPAITGACRRILSRRVARETGGETALLNSVGRALWMTDGFPFLWNALNGRPIPHEGLLPSSTLRADATPLERLVARRSVLLDTNDRQRMATEISTGSADQGRLDGLPIVVRFERSPGRVFGCRGSLLWIRLDRESAAEC